MQEWNKTHHQHHLWSLFRTKEGDQADKFRMTLNVPMKVLYTYLHKYTVFTPVSTASKKGNNALKIKEKIILID